MQTPPIIMPHYLYAPTLAARRSGQVSDRQWEDHLRDPNFKEWADLQPTVEDLALARNPATPTPGAG